MKVKWWRRGIRGMNTKQNSDTYFSPNTKPQHHSVRLKNGGSRVKKIIPPHTVHSYTIDVTEGHQN